MYRRGCSGTFETFTRPAHGTQHILRRMTSAVVCDDDSEADWSRKLENMRAHLRQGMPD